MPATVTLATTTLTAQVAVGDTQISVASTSGLTPGIRLWVDRELMAVVGLGVNTQVNVRRGVDYTAASDHVSGSIVTIGRGDQFYTTDPQGRPPEAVLVSPYINVLSGSVFFAQGDASSTSNRWWQQQTVTYDKGALGIGTATLFPTSST